MNSKTAAGQTFPDFERPDHRTTRRLSGLQGMKSMGQTLTERAGAVGEYINAA